MAKKQSTRRTTSKTTRKTAARATRGGTSRRSSTPKRSTPRRSTRKSPAKKRSPRRQPKREPFSLNLRQKALILGIVLIFLTAVIILSLLSPSQGELTRSLAGLMWRAFGWGGFFVPVGLAAGGFYLVLWGMEQPPSVPTFRVAGLGLLFVTFEVFAALMAVRTDTALPDVWAAARIGAGGGYLGALVAALGQQALGTLGTVFIFLVLGFVAAIMAIGVSRADLGLFLQHLAERRAAPQTAVAERERPIRINPGRAPRPVQQPIDFDKPPEIVVDIDIAEEPAAATAPEPARRRRARETGAPRPSRTTPAPARPANEPTAPTPVFVNNNRSAGTWQLPVLAETLESGADQDTNDTSIREQVEIIEHTLESFGAPATVVEINQGPTITQFGVEPRFIEQRSGKRTKVKVGKIASLADDLALALAARSIRIQAPVPGKGYVGIEVPNTSKALVSLRDVMESPEYLKIKSPLRIGLGQNVAGQPIVADLAAMPHLLIAGTTGSGKSVCVNAIIACLLLQNTPDELKLVMVDPKRVELTGYNGIPHLAAPVVVDMERVIGTLQWALREMENRYKLFATQGARNITDYNKKIRRQKNKDALPFIVIIIDELADLMMLSPEETERGVTRLAQMARATGIHMVIATQRPSVDVVTGLIKANFPARVAFAVASSTDSRVILDSTGAERLLGQGDMLFQSPDAAAPIRMQGCFVSEAELVGLIGFWQTARRFNLVRPDGSADATVTATAPAPTQPSPPATAKASPDAARPAPAANGAPAAAKPPAQPAPATDDTPETRPMTPRPAPSPAAQAPPPPQPEVAPPIIKKPAADDNQQRPLWEELQRLEEEAAQAQYHDELMPDCVALVRQLGKASTSLLQRRFRIGYTRAARIIDVMEEQGIIGPPTGTSKAREVLPWGDDRAAPTATDGAQPGDLSE